MQGAVLLFRKNNSFHDWQEHWKQYRRVSYSVYVFFQSWMSYVENDWWKRLIFLLFLSWKHLILSFALGPYRSSSSTSLLRKIDFQTIRIKYDCWIIILTAQCKFKLPSQNSFYGCAFDNWCSKEGLWTSVFL